VSIVYIQRDGSILIEFIFPLDDFLAWNDAYRRVPFPHMVVLPHKLCQSLQNDVLIEREGVNR
jgi:hypothetical protein